MRQRCIFNTTHDFFSLNDFTFCRRRRCFFESSKIFYAPTHITCHHKAYYLFGNKTPKKKFGFHAAAAKKKIVYCINNSDMAWQQEWFSIWMTHPSDYILKSLILCVCVCAHFTFNSFQFSTEGEKKTESNATRDTCAFDRFIHSPLSHIFA